MNIIATIQERSEYKNLRYMEGQGVATDRDIKGFLADFSIEWLEYFDDNAIISGKELLAISINSYGHQGEEDPLEHESDQYWKDFVRVVLDTLVDQEGFDIIEYSEIAIEILGVIVHL